MDKTKHYAPLLFILFILSSCIPQQNLDYLQDKVTGENKYPLQEEPVNVIKPNDELYINVTSFDDVSFNFFQDAGNNYARTGFSNELSVSLISYTVDENGDVFFPILGNVHLAGHTIDEARKMLMDLLADYLNQPVVILKFAYKKITVLGEVRAPGNYTYSKDKLSIFEALGMAGDMTVHGNRKEVYLLRPVADSITKYKLDLTDDNLVFSKYYYIQADDTIYVKTRSSQKWGIISVPITLAFTSISTILLIINYIQTN